MVNNYLNKIRHEFSSQKLDETEVLKDPILQLEKWIEEAVDAQILEPNAMTVSTVNQDGQPSARVVYLRGVSSDGLKLYTNYNSQKGEDVKGNPKVSALFFYSELERQVRVEGLIEKLSEQESNEYFDARPIESKIGAWASEQSSRITSRADLEKRIDQFRLKFGENVPRPPHWGGYLIRPTKFEFWQGRPARLHDRLVFSKAGADWQITRLAP